VKKWILLAIYAIDVFFCLRAIKQKSSHEYVLTKPFLMPLLCGLYFAFLPEVLRSAPHQKFVLYALMFHTLGDVLLLFPRTKTKAFFYAGMASFFLGHVGYCLWFITAPVGHSHKLAFFTLFAVLICEYLLFRQLMLGARRYASKLLPYSLGLAILAVSVASTFGNGTDPVATLISLIGVALFCFSDYCIERRLVRMPLFGQMMVMTTYIAGQTLIVLGMLLLQI
jgi:uncharacterized membrane protein YhhN